MHWNPVCFVPDHAKPDEVIVFYKTGTVSLTSAGKGTEISRSLPGGRT